MLDILFSQKKLLSVGDTAPDFALPNQHKVTVQLNELLKASSVVLFFYPKNNTPICTQEVCSFRDAYEGFQKHSVQLLGISSDNSDSHADFSKRHQLPYDLLSDIDGSVAKQYGLQKTLGLLPGRVTFVIDQSHVIQMAYANSMNASLHIQQALETLQSMTTQ